jgi:hypothetical protein
VLEASDLVESCNLQTATTNYVRRMVHLLLNTDAYLVGNISEHVWIVVYMQGVQKLVDQLHLLESSCRQPECVDAACQSDVRELDQSDCRVEAHTEEMGSNSTSTQVLIMTPPACDMGSASE